MASKKPPAEAGGVGEEETPRTGAFTRATLGGAREAGELQEDDRDTEQERPGEHGERQPNHEATARGQTLYIGAPIMLVEIHRESSAQEVNR